jgi:hypothetical protein
MTFGTSVTEPRRLESALAESIRRLINMIGRSRRSARTAVGALVALMATLLIANPVAASVDLGDKGTVGPHTLIDSHSAASVGCTYTTVSELMYWQGKLTRIEVQPPALRPVAGVAQQMVGWRFIVWRYRYLEKAGLTHSIWDPHSVTYRSPIQTTLATATDDAAFSPMSVAVNVPPGTLKRNWAYNVAVKMFWYARDGSTMGTAKHLLSKEELIVKGDSWKITAPWCEGRLAIAY